MTLRALPALATATALLFAGSAAHAQDPAAPATAPEAPAAAPEAPAAAPEAPAPAPAATAPAPTADAGAPAMPLEQQMRAAKRVRTIGGVNLGLGAVMIAVGAGLEHKRRNDICKEHLSEDHENACDDSLRANVAVLAMGVTLTLGGAVLVGIGQSRIKRLRSTMAERGISLTPAVGRGFAGASFTARF